jgi:hypothetical protein
MKRLVKWLVIIGMFAFSYFAWTKVEVRRSGELKRELYDALARVQSQDATIKMWEHRGTENKLKMVELHKALSLAFPDRETQIGDLLGIEPESEATEVADAAAEE